MTFFSNWLEGEAEHTFFGNWRSEASCIDQINHENSNNTKPTAILAGVKGNQPENPDQYVSWSFEVFCLLPGATTRDQEAFCSNKADASSGRQMRPWFKTGPQPAEFDREQRWNLFKAENNLIRI